MCVSSEESVPPRLRSERRWPERRAKPGRPRRRAEEAREARPLLRETVLRDEERFPEIAARPLAQRDVVFEQVMRGG
jgi:hypothetical protein